MVRLATTLICGMISLCAISLHAEDATGQPSVAHIEPFDVLPLSAHEAKIITKLISTMAEKNVVQLMFEKRDLEKKGRRINPVHPMKFVGYVFADPYLKQCMKSIKKSHFKWDNFIDGYSRRMKEEAEKNNLIPHVNGFCRATGADREGVIKLIEDRDWEGLIIYLL